MRSGERGARRRWVVDGKGSGAGELRIGKHGARRWVVEFMRRLAPVHLRCG